MEEWVYELCRQLHESGEIILQGGIDIIVFVVRHLEVLFELEQVRKVDYEEIVRLTLKRFFSSLSDFSFLSLSLPSELLKRS